MAKRLHSRLDIQMQEQRAELQRPTVLHLDTHAVGKLGDREYLLRGDVDACRDGSLPLVVRQVAAIRQIGTRSSSS
jgi:hypothetical protein